MIVIPIIAGEVQVFVDVQQDLLEEAQPVLLGLLGDLKHLLHVLHVAWVAAVQLLQSLLIALLCLELKIRQLIRPLASDTDHSITIFTCKTRNGSKW